MKIINIQYGYRYEEQTTTLREYDNQQKVKSPGFAVPVPASGSKSKENTTINRYK